MLGVDAGSLLTAEVLAIHRIVSVAAVAVVDVPVGAVAREAGQRVDGADGIVDDLDTAVHVVFVGSTLGKRIIVALISAFDVSVCELTSVVEDLLCRIHTAVYAVVPDYERSIAVVGNYCSVNTVLLVYESGSIADPCDFTAAVISPVGACAAPPIQTYLAIIETEVGRVEMVGPGVFRMIGIILGKLEVKILNAGLGVAAASIDCFFAGRSIKGDSVGITRVVCNSVE